MKLTGRARLKAALSVLEAAQKFQQVANSLADRLPLERKLYRATLRLFKQQHRALLRLLPRLKPEFPPPQLREAGPADSFETLWPLVELETIRAYALPLRTVQRLAFERGARATLAKAGFDIGFNMDNARAQDFLRRAGADRIRAINDATRETIRRILVQAAEEGWDYQKTARAISERFSEFTRPQPQLHIRNRAELVAVTETANAYVAGNMEAGRTLIDSGIPLRKSWLTVGDERVCEICAGGEGDGWIDFDALFSNGLDAPPGHPGCRCDVLMEPVG